MLEIIDSGTPLAKCYFADNDLIAIGAIKALKLRGYKIPDDIAIIGFDNISEGRILDPSLTTFHGSDRRRPVDPPDGRSCQSYRQIADLHIAH